MFQSVGPVDVVVDCPDAQAPWVRLQVRAGAQTLTAVLTLNEASDLAGALREAVRAGKAALVAESV